MGPSEKLLAIISPRAPSSVQHDRGGVCNFIAVAHGIFASHGAISPADASPPRNIDVNVHLGPAESTCPSHDKVVKPALGRGIFYSSYGPFSNVLFSPLSFYARA